jgi:hypothetical protein
MGQSVDNAEDLAAAAEAAQHILVTNPDDAGLASARRAIKRVWPQISAEGVHWALGHAQGTLRERRRVLNRLVVMESEGRPN